MKIIKELMKYKCQFIEIVIVVLFELFNPVPKLIAAVSISRRINN